MNLELAIGSLSPISSGTLGGCLIRNYPCTYVTFQYMIKKLLLNFILHSICLFIICFLFQVISVIIDYKYLSWAHDPKSEAFKKENSEVIFSVLKH